MKKVLILLIIALIASYGYSQEKNFIDQPYLETSAKVDTLVIPDRIYLHISISEKDTKDKISIEELEKEMNKKLKSLGINLKKQLEVDNFSSMFKKYLLKKKDIVKNKSYTLLVYDAKTASEVMRELEKINISNIYLSRTEYSKEKQLSVKLKQRAIADAKFNAATMLKPLNQKLGKAIYIKDNNSFSATRFSDKSYDFGNYGVSYAPVIEVEIKKIKIESSVTVIFRID